MSDLRIGVLGCAHYSHAATYVRALQADGRCTLVGVDDASPGLAEAFAAELGIPVLGSMHVGRLASGRDPGLSAARARLQRLGQRDQGTVFLLTGTVRPERTAEFAEALARAFAVSSRTVLVDADLSARSTSRRLQLDGAPGLADLLDGHRGGSAAQEMFRPEQVSVTTVNGSGYVAPS